MLSPEGINIAKCEGFNIEKGVVSLSETAPEELSVNGEFPISISWVMYLVCIECSSGKKFVSVERCF